MSRLAIVGLLLVACGSLPAGSSMTPSPTAHATQPLPTFAGTGTDTCALMPLADVQSKSPFQTPLSQIRQTSDVCEYRSVDDAGDQVSILLEINNFGLDEAARISLANARQGAVDSGLPTSDVPGLGQTAFASGVDDVGVYAVAGGVFITAKMKGEWPDTTDEAKVAAGTELVRTIISRLP